MQYRKDRSGTDISILGYGCLRFSKKGNAIDLEKTEKEIIKAIEGGVNYFDTAYVYSGSEAALGTILERNHLREKVMIATKLPHYLIRSRAGMEKCFEEQLKRLRTDYIDYYLMHMLTDVETWEKLIGLGILDWLLEKKKEGKIKNIGFSYHGSTDHFIELIDAYDWDFCQIQYNYMDENSQAGRKGLLYAYEKGIPVIIMEGLRGGKLVDMLPEKAKELIASNKRGWSPAEWAFRWLMQQKEVMCVLSGMNSLQMVSENLKTADEVRIGEFQKEDEALIEAVKEEINRNMKVGCTACGYCMPCPAGVDIPGTFRCYNSLYTENNRKSTLREYMRCTIFRKNPSSASQCIKCGKCEKHCPQGIEIRKELQNAAGELEDIKYRSLKKIIRLFRFW